MEFVDGRTINSSARKGCLPFKEACSVLRQMAEALSYVSKNKLIPIGVKPDTSMIGSDGQAKLCDLGLAKLAHYSDSRDGRRSHDRRRRHRAVADSRRTRRRNAQLHFAGSRSAGTAYRRARRHLRSGRNLLPHRHRPSAVRERSSKAVMKRTFRRSPEPVRRHKGIQRAGAASSPR